jgi:hypothetical protein
MRHSDQSEALLVSGGFNATSRFSVARHMAHAKWRIRFGMRHLSIYADRLAVTPVIAIVAITVIAAAVAPAIVDTEHAVHSPDDTTNTRADRTADDAANGTSRAIAPVNTFICATFHTPENALCMRCDRQRQDSERGRDEGETAVLRGKHEQSFGLHCGTSPCAVKIRHPSNAAVAGKLR